MLNTNQLITLLQLPQMGRKSVISIAEYAKLRKISPQDNNELKQLLDECRQKKVARALKEYLPVEIDTATAFAQRIEETAEENQMRITPYNDSRYPAILKALKKEGKDDFPVVIYTMGNFSILTDLPGVAIIGTREPSLAGSVATTHIAEEFAKNGFNIVSGLALGCDTLAHRAALNVGGKTTAVLAHGLGTIYPPENRGLANEIVENGGLLLSEYPIGTKAQQIYFVERDRLQAGLSQATIAVEGQATSGSRHALNTAIENQRASYCTSLSKEMMPSTDGLLFCDGPTLLTEDNLQDTIQQIKAEVV